MSPCDLFKVNNKLLNFLLQHPRHLLPSYIILPYTLSDFCCCQFYFFFFFFSSLVQTYFELKVIRAIFWFHFKLSGKCRCHLFFFVFFFFSISAGCQKHWSFFFLDIIYMFVCFFIPYF